MPSGTAGVRSLTYFLTGHGTIPMSVRAIKGGPMSFRPNRLNPPRLSTPLNPRSGWRKTTPCVTKEHYALKQRHMSPTRANMKCSSWR